MTSRTLRDKRGFTLVELLVVVAIIIALVAILVPALSRSVDSAQAAGSLSNLGQLGKVLRTYGADRDLWMPPPLDQTLPRTDWPTWGGVLVKHDYIADTAVLTSPAYQPTDLGDWDTEETHSDIGTPSADNADHPQEHTYAMRMGQESDSGFYKAMRQTAFGNSDTFIMTDAVDPSNQANAAEEYYVLDKLRAVLRLHDGQAAVLFGDISSRRTDRKYFETDDGGWYTTRDNNNWKIVYDPDDP